MEVLIYWLRGWRTSGPGQQALEEAPGQAPGEGESLAETAERLSDRIRAMGGRETLVTSWWRAFLLVAEPSGKTHWAS